MADLIPLAVLKSHLGVAANNSTEDDRLATLISQVSALVESHVGPVSPAATYTEYLDGTGSQFLTLSRGRVTAVSSVYVDEQGAYGVASGAFPSTTLLPTTQYALRSPAGVLFRVGQVWPRPAGRYRGDLTGGKHGPLFGTGNVKVTYTAGYDLDSVPGDLQLAVADVIGIIRSGAGRGGMLQNESYDGYSYSLGGLDTQRAWLGYLQGAGGAILARHRRLAV